MSDLTQDHTADAKALLAYAQEFIDHGIPVVVCSPADGDKRELRHPSGWSQIQAAECDLSGFRPGIDTLAMVGGHGLDVVDVDTKDGGSIDNLPPFRHFGEHRTPSGGGHYFVRSTGFGKVSPFKTSAGHVGDYVGGTRAGGSRLLAFLPGSTRPKYPGKTYSVVEPIRWDEWEEFTDPDDDLIGALVSVGASRDGLPGHPAATRQAVSEFLAEHSTEPEQRCNYGTQALAGMLDNSYETEAGDAVKGRHAWAVRSALRAVELVRGGCLWSGDLDALEARLAVLKPEEDWHEALAYAITNSDGMTACALHCPTDPRTGLNSGSAVKQEPGTDKHAADLAAEVQRLRIRDEAKREYAAELAAEHAEDFDALFLDRAQLSEMRAPSMLIEGVMPSASNAILSGRDSTYKTFVAIDMALHIATGRQWQGHEVEQGKVLYIAGEGAYGIGKRINAWEEHHGVQVNPAGFVVRKAALNLHTPGAAADHLLRYIEAGGYRFVVIDTMRRVSGGADGNSSEMGAVIDSIDRIKLATKEGSTLTLAHTDKGDNDTRGWSGIEDDIECVWHSERKPPATQLTLKNTKMKDAEEHEPVTLDAIKVAGSLALGPAAQIDNGDSHEWQVLNWIASETDATEVTAAMVIKGTGLPKPTVYRWLKKLVERGQLDNVGTAKRPIYQHRRAGS